MKIVLERRNLTRTLRDTCQGKARRWLGVFGVVAGLAACARTGLDPGEVDPFVGENAAGGTSGASTPTPSDASMAGMPADPPGSSLPPHDADTPTVPPDDPNDPEPCVPTPETCNGRDDDCNDQVDDLPGEPCPGGGFRYCIAGQLSDCPRSCEVCVPGSLRICQNSYCLYWGEQECAADGQGFGPCREARPPPRCATIARQKHNSPELEQCCIDDGYCCLDMHDLDDDGDRREMLGACDGVRCP